MVDKEKKRKRKNPFPIIVLLTLLMTLPFIAFLLDKVFLLKLDNSILFFAEIMIITLGISSGLLIYFFFLRK